MREELAKYLANSFKEIIESELRDFEIIQGKDLGGEDAKAEIEELREELQSLKDREDHNVTIFNLIYDRLFPYCVPVTSISKEDLSFICEQLSKLSY